MERVSLENLQERKEVKGLLFVKLQTWSHKRLWDCLSNGTNAEFSRLFSFLSRLG